MAQEENGEAKLLFHYQKSAFFRVVHVDGVYGGAAPNSEHIHVAVFNERIPLPQMTALALAPVPGKPGQYRVGKEAGRVGKDGVLREVEADLVMTVETAEKVAKWLQEKVNEARKKRAVEAEPKETNE